MATTIKLKNGAGAPTTGDLVQGEPAFDLTNKRLYTEDSGGSVIEIGTSPSTIDINAGTIDGTVIGGSSAAAGTFTTFTSTGIDDNASSTAITIDSSQNTTFAGTITSGDIIVADATPFIRLQDSDGTNQYTQVSNINGNGYIGARNDAADASFLVGGYGGGSFNEFARWNDAGHLSQKYNLTVEGAFTSLGIDDNATSTAITIDSSGRVSIGTTSATELLNIAAGSSTGAGVEFAGNGNTVGSTSAFYGQGSGSDAYVWNRANSTVLFGTNNTERMRIRENGQVLVGGTVNSPANVRMVVFGTGNATGVYNTGHTGIHINNDAASGGVGAYGAGLSFGRFGGSSDDNSAMIVPVQTTSDQDHMGLSFFTHNTNTRGNPLGEVMRINSTGQLTVAGTTSGFDTTPAVNGLQAHYETDSGEATLGSYSSGGSTFMTFHTNSGGGASAERMRIDASGNLLVGMETLSTSDAGVQVRNDGLVRANRSGAQPLIINRTSDDGTLVSFLQDGSTEGTISVSGTTVSYNGGHLSRWSQLDTDDVSAIYKGTVMSNLDEMCEWDNEDNEQLNKTKVSDVEGDVNVAGVFVAKDNSDDLSDYYLAMTGDMIIRIAQGTAVQRGDLLMSAGDGTAKPQDDDIVRSKTIAKVTSTNVTCTYADGSYCVPCVLMAC
jgi:hypothetical protein